MAAAGLIVLAGKGYTGADDPVITPYRSRNKPASQKAANRAHAQLRAPSERANAQLKTWHILRKLRCCPWRAGHLAKAIHVLRAREIAGCKTPFGQRHHPLACRARATHGYRQGGGSMNDARVPAPPGGLRPGLVGVVLLGRVIMGDIAVTLVDLAQRELVRAEESEAGGWLVSSLPGPGSRQSLPGYEGKLLEGLCGSPTAIAGQPPPVLEAVRSALVEEAVQRGWLRPLDHGRRTADGETMARHVRSFERDLRRLKRQQGEDAMAGSLLPYALNFALVSRDKLPLARFAQAWVDAYASLPGWGTQQRPASKKSLDEQLPELTIMSWTASS